MELHACKACSILYLNMLGAAAMQCMHCGCHYGRMQALVTPASLDSCHGSADDALRIGLLLPHSALVLRCKAQPTTRAAPPIMTTVARSHTALRRVHCDSHCCL